MPYIGEIRLFAGNFPPSGWALCNGQQLSTSDFPDLFEVLGTSFGGDGVESFALPDLRGRVPVHIDDAISLGQQGGSELALLDLGEMPEHEHLVFASRLASVASSPIDRVFATGKADGSTEATAGSKRVLARTTRTGAGNAHDNMQPFICLNYIIAIEGELGAGSGEST